MSCKEAWGKDLLLTYHPNIKYIPKISKYVQDKKLHLYQIIRHLRGEEVDGLSIRDLQGVEMQLDTALKKTRSRKVIYMYTKTL